VFYKTSKQLQITSISIDPDIENVKTQGNYDINYFLEVFNKELELNNPEYLFNKDSVFT
jgi:hypothetical protein